MCGVGQQTGSWRDSVQWVVGGWVQPGGRAFTCLRLRRSIRKNGNVLKPLKNIRGGFPGVFCEDILILSTKPMGIVMYIFKIRFSEKFEVEIASL